MPYAMDEALPRADSPHMSAVGQNTTTDNLSFEKFYTAVYINVTIGALCILIFSLIHRRRNLGLYEYLRTAKEGNR